MPDQTPQAELDDNRIHADRSIRRSLDKEGHVFGEGERESLLLSAIEAAKNNNGTHARRYGAIDRVIAEYKAKQERDESTPEAEEETPQADLLPKLTPLDTEGLPGPTIKALSEAGIGTIEGLVAWKRDNGEFINLHGVGMATASKLNAMLPSDPDPVEQDESE